MQYLLTQEELDELEKHKLEFTKKFERQLGKLCKLAADHVPVNAGWRDTEPSPWGCIYSEEDEWYCDDCPAKEVCPLDQHWSQ